MLTMGRWAWEQLYRIVGCRSLTWGTEQTDVLGMMQGCNNWTQTEDPAERNICRGGMGCHRSTSRI